MSDFVFTLNSFAISNTRAAHNDTDYVALGLSVNGVPSAPQVKKVGNVDNGTHQVNLTIPLATINEGDKYALSYLVLNHGGGKTGDILTRCANAMTQTQLKDFSPLDVMPATGILRTAAEMNTLWNLVKALFKNSSSDWCDGPVAIDRFSFLGRSVTSIQLASQQTPLSIIYEGIDSHDGCGSNSDYSVQWSVQAR
jgi:hypothetical protein